MLGKTLERIYHACWYVFAAVVLSTALVITIVRVMLPHANDYREELQNLISEHTGYTVRIDNVQGDWKGWVPTLYLKGIEIQTGPGKPDITRLESASIRFDPFASFRQGQFTPFHLTITGPELTIIRRQDDSFQIGTNGKHEVASGTAVDNTAFSNWLLLQKTIFIRGARVRFLDARKEFNPVKLSNVDLLLKNSISHMQVEGSMVLPEEYGEKCSFALDIYGDIATPDWSGQIYVDARHVHPDAWLSHFDTDAMITLTSDSMDIRVWSNWQQARLTRINGMFDATQVRLIHGTTRLDVNHINSMFSVSREPGQDLRASLKVKELLTSNGAWPETEISIISRPVTKGGASRYVIHSNYLNLGDVLVFGSGENAAALPVSSDHLSISGNLQDNVLVYDPSLPPAERFAFNARIRDLAVQNDDYRVHNLRGVLSGTFSRGLLRLDTPATELDLPGLVNKTYTFHELQGEVQWYADKDSVRIETAQLQAHTLHFNSVLQGSMVFTAGDDLPFVDMLWSVSELDLEDVKYYLPLALPERTRTWIRHALVAGDVSTLDMVLRGPLADFPFDNGEGRVEAIAAIHNATLDYHENWIPVKNMEAELRMDGRILTVDANAGNIYNATITHALATIDRLHADANDVSVKGSIKGQAGEAIKFINNTPLSASHLLGELSRQAIEGPFQLDLGLLIPFDATPISYNGNIKLEDAKLTSSTLNIELDHVAGAVMFDNNSVADDNLAAEYAGEPVTLTINSKEHSDPTYGLEGSSGKDFIVGQLVHFFPGLGQLRTLLAERLDGGCEWSAVLTPANAAVPGSNGISKRLKIASTLSGLAVNLPAPLGKTYVTVPLAISTVITTAAPRQTIDFSYGDEVTGRIDLDRNGKTVLSGMELVLGAGKKLSGTASGITINGTTADLSLSDWYGFLNTLDPGTSNGPAANLQIDISAGTLSLLGQRFQNTQFKLLSETSVWHVILDGPAIGGDVFLPKNPQPAGVSGTFSRLALSKSEETGPSTDLNPGSFPPLQFTIDKFKYQDINLGKVELSTAPAADGMSVDKLAFTQPGLEITGNGKWSTINGNNRSDFVLELHAETLSKMLTTFNYSEEPVKDGDSRFRLNAQWPGAPTDFKLAGITGTLDMEIDKGQFLNIEPKAGRLFGLLNLQSLIRLLSLDFTVLFSKGYTFDHIDGTFTIESGDAYTNNLAVKGRSADITITGRTGLVDKDYDQIATVSPHTLFGPIGAGVEAVIIIAGEVFQSLPEKFDKLLQYQYTIKGGWDAPVIKKYNSEF